MFKYFMLFEFYILNFMLFEFYEIIMKCLILIFMCVYYIYYAHKNNKFYYNYNHCTFEYKIKY